MVGFMQTSAEAVTFTVNPALSNATIPFQTIGTPTGATVQFTIDAPAEVQIDIFKVQNFGDPGTQVASLIQTYATSGAKQQFWNGHWLIADELGRKNGNFEFVVTASTNGTTATYTIPTLLQITSIDIHNVSVNPTLDGNNNPIFPYTISYNLAKNALVTVVIRDASSSIVRTLFSNRAQVGENTATNSVTWDGLGDGGQPVANGVYTISIDATDTSNNDVATTRTRTIAVGSLAGLSAAPKDLFEQSVYVFPNPVRGSVGGTFRFQAIRDNANVSLKIYTITGDLVYETTRNNLSAGQVVTIPWNVKNQSGSTVGRGLYYYVIREDDPQGTLQTVKKMVVVP